MTANSISEVSTGAEGMIESEVTGRVDIPATAAYIGNYLHKSFPMVERDDIVQEVFAWVYSHPDKVDQWLDEEEHGKNKLHKAMRHAGLKYCQDEKARILGYKVDDLYFYELGLIRDTLERIWDDEAWTSPPQPHEETKVKHHSVAEGGNYLATLCDVSRVVSALPEDEQLLLRWHYADGYTANELADRMDTTRAAIESKLNRLVRKLQRMLGGERTNTRD